MKDEKRTEAVEMEFPNAFKYGLRISILLLLAGLTVGLVSKYWNRKSAVSRPGQNTVAEDIGIRPVLCDGLDKPVISSGSPEVSQMVMRGCFSPVAVARSLPKDRIDWQAPGEVFICLLRRNRCAALLHVPRGGKPLHKLRGEVPDDYEEILFKGDPGAVHLKFRR